MIDNSLLSSAKTPDVIKGVLRKISIYVNMNKKNANLVIHPFKKMKNLKNLKKCSGVLILCKICNKNYKRSEFDDHECKCDVSFKNKKVTKEEYETF
jgi:hypothetical protein